MSLAGSMYRTLKRQVVPDTMLWRRLRAKFSSGVPLAETRKTSTLLGHNSVFNDVDITYMFSEKAGKGSLEFSVPIFTESAAGSPSTAMRRFSLFSYTSKMSSPSFSLPAGPPREGGTCAAADRGARNLVRPSKGNAPGGARKNAQGKDFICDLCYATAGNYYYPNVSTAQAARMIWCERMLEADPTGQTLGRALVEAITNEAIKAHYGNLSKRMGQELGIWHNGQIHVPGLISGRRGLTPVPTLPTELPSWTGYRSSNEFFQSQGVEDGAIAGFFRIHDSGDLNIGGKLETWKAYLNAWTYVAKALPWVWFWMPVRTWVNKPMIPELQAANEIPNLVIRVSPLYVDGKPPKIPGMSFSGVHSGAPPKTVYPCPVRPRDSSSCAEQGCRVCWIAPSLVPSYSEH